MATVVTARGFPPDVTEEEVRKFVLLDPGEDGIKRIDIKRGVKEAEARIFFVNPETAQTATCFDGARLKGRAIRILEPEEEDEVDKEINALIQMNREEESALAKKEFITPASPPPPPAPTNAPAAVESPKEGISPVSAPKTTLETSSATPALGTKRRRVAKRLILGILLIVIALLAFLALTARKPEERLTETQQQKFQQLDKQLEELEKLLSE